MSADFGPRVAVGIVLACLPLVPLGAALMTLVAAFTRSYREAQTYVGLVLLIPTLPLIFAVDPRTAAASGAHGDSLPGPAFHHPQPHQNAAAAGAYVALSVCSTLVVGALLVFAAGRLYRREALLG